MLSADELKMKLNISGFSGAVTNNDVESAFIDFYARSPKFRSRVDQWFAANSAKRISITYTALGSRAILPTGSGNVLLNPDNDIVYISTFGEAIQMPWQSILLHELGHGLIEGSTDDSRFADLRGTNVRIVNEWFAELNIPLEVGFLARGTNLTVGLQYTDSEEIEHAIVDREGVDTVFNSVVREQVDFRSRAVNGSVLYCPSSEHLAQV